MESNGQTKPVVFLGMPGSGRITPGAARGFYRASLRQRLDVRLAYEESSLLALNMNKLWCRALNLCRSGGIGLDYFAMLHTDIEPEEGWLEKLIDELEAHNLDLLGVAAPIKDPRGVTSIAIARPDQDTWGVHSRLTMSEVHRLPPTFTGADLGGLPLLINTGCWVCRFDEPWAGQVHFRVNDRIVFDPAKNEYRPECEPEDWYFSRLCHDTGKRVGCTRIVGLDHRGDALFTNRGAWGQQEHDEAHVAASIVPAVDRDGFLFPHDIDGWLSFDEGKALWELARGKRVLEIGSYCGRSTVCLGQSAASVLAVDPHDGRGTPRPKNTYRELRQNLKRYTLSDVVQVHIGTSESLPQTSESLPQTSESLPNYSPFNLAFIDGAHDLESVRMDIRQALRFLAPDGLLAFHDYRLHPGEGDGRWDPGVTQAVHELIGAGGQVCRRVGSLAIVRPAPAAELLTTGG